MNVNQIENSMVAGAQAQIDQEDAAALDYENRVATLKADFVQAVAKFAPIDLWKALPETDPGTDVANYLTTDRGFELFGKALQAAAAHNYMGAGRLLEEIVLACANQYGEMFADSAKRPVIRPPVGAVYLEPARVELTADQFAAMGDTAGVVA